MITYTYNINYIFIIFYKRMHINVSQAIEILATKSQLVGKLLRLVHCAK